MYTYKPLDNPNPQIKLKDIYVKSHNDTFVKIKDHPYYTSLHRNNKGIYLEHVKGSAFQSKKPTADWDVFKNLYQTIKQNGLDLSKRDKITIIRKDDKWCCIHGRHRTCILYKIKKHTAIELDGKHIKTVMK